MGSWLTTSLQFVVTPPPFMVPGGLKVRGGGVYNEMRSGQDGAAGEGTQGTPRGPKCHFGSFLIKIQQVL